MFTIHAKKFLNFTPFILKLMAKDIKPWLYYFVVHVSSHHRIIINNYFVALIYIRIGSCFTSWISVCISTPPPPKKKCIGGTQILSHDLSKNICSTVSMHYLNPACWVDVVKFVTLKTRVFRVGLIYWDFVQEAVSYGRCAGFTQQQCYTALLIQNRVIDMAA